MCSKSTDHVWIFVGPTQGVWLGVQPVRGHIYDDIAWGLRRKMRRQHSTGHAPTFLGSLPFSGSTTRWWRINTTP